MGSGSYVDLVVIKPKDDVQYLRTFDEANVKGERREKYTYPKGATAVLSEKVRDIKVGDKNHVYIVDEVVRPIAMEVA
jgi:20S proteasome subunit beta 2